MARTEKLDPNVCMDAVIKAGAGSLTREDAKNLIRHFDQIRTNKDFANAEELIQKHGMDLAQQAEIQAVRKAKTTLQQTQIENSRVADASRPQFKTPKDGVVAKLGGILGDAEGSRDSTDYKIKGIKDTQFGRLMVSMMKDGADKVFMSDGLQFETMQELEQLRMGEKGSPGVSKQPLAQKIASHIHDTMAYLRDRLNLAGADIGDLFGFIMSTVHDGDKIRNIARPTSLTDPVSWFRKADRDASFEIYKDDVLGKDGQKGMWNKEKTFGKDATWDEMVQKTRAYFDSFVDHNHLKAQGAEDQKGGFPGAASLAKRISQGRDIHMDGAEGTLAYSNKYGNGSLAKTIQDSIDKAARNIGLMEDWGPNWRQGLDNVVQQLKRDFAGKDIVNSLDSSLIDNIAKNLDGSVSIPKNSTLASVVSAIRLDQHLAKMGMMGLHATTDLQSISAELRRSGMNDVDAHMAPLLNWMQLGGGEDAKYRAMSAGQALQGMKLQTNSKLGLDTPKGLAGRAEHLFFKGTGIDFVDNVNQKGFVTQLTSELGRIRGMTLEEMKTKEPDRYNQLKQYDITDAQWDLYRKTAYRVGPDGVESRTPTTDNSQPWHITPDQMHTLSDEDIADAMVKDGNQNPTANNIKRYRNELDSTLSAYISDRADFSVPKPGAYEKAAFLNRGLQAGTVERAFWDLWATYKGFAIAMGRKGITSQIVGAGSVLTKASNVAQTIVGLTLLGYAQYAASDIISGRKPRSWVDSPGKTLIDSMVKGGGGSLYGDFLFGDFSTTGRSAVNQFLGPVLGQIDPIMAEFSQGVRGKDVAPQIANQIKTNTPFLNLWFAKAALNYGILWQLQEALKPGSLQTGEDNSKTQGTQPYFVPPSSVIPRGGGSYPGEGLKNLSDRLLQ